MTRRDVEQRRDEALQLVRSQLDRHGEGWESMRESVRHEGGWPGILDAYATVAAATP